MSKKLMWQTKEKEDAMAIPNQVVEQIIERANIYDVISRYTTLKRSGSDAKGLCPFHSEKTPSFHVSEQKQVYHCFGCGAKGTVISFISAMENLSFVEAVKFLGDMYSIRVEEQSYADDKTANRKKKIYEINKIAARYFYDNLVSEKGLEARKYLMSRGLSAETITRFGLGYAENSYTALIKTLKSKGYTDYEIKDAGLSAQKDKRAPYDFFRNRVMFPVFDVRGNVIAFGGRVLDDSKPKYLNSPETLVFDKRKNLFGLNLAKKNTDKRLILVEGYMDVIALHQQGITNAVASLGTALTKDHAHLVKRYADEIVLCYDSDEAGQTAAARGVEILSGYDIKTKVILLRGAKDPDEYIKKFGVKSFLDSIDGAKVPVLHNIEALKAKYDISVPEQKVEFLKRAASELCKLSSPMEREVYIREVANMTDVTYKTLEGQVNRAYSMLARKNSDKEKVKVAQDLRQKTVIKDSSSQACIELEKQLLNLMFYDYEACMYIKENFNFGYFSNEFFLEFASKVLLHREESKTDLKESEFISSFDFELSGELADIISIDLHFEDRLNGAKQIINKINAFKKKEEILRLSKSGDIEKVRDLISHNNQH